MRTAAARLFGLITYTQSRFELTPLGFEILGSDERVRRTARATAFFSVPLFSKVYNEFKGKQLPPRPHGLEAAFARFGVPDKQRGNARIAFDKSARQAGFFDAGADRLVEPIIAGAALSGMGTVAADASVIKGDSGAPVFRQSKTHEREDGDLHPFIRGLLETLPKVDSDWPIEGRRRWLQTAAYIFDLLYKGDGTIAISADKASD